MKKIESVELVTMNGDKKPDLDEDLLQCKEPPQKSSCLQLCSNWIIDGLETSFFRLGLLVARHPFLTILVCLLICGICGIGLNKFEENQTTDDAKLWVPKSSRVLPEKKWVDENFPETTRFTSYIITAPNILSPVMINALYDIYVESKSVVLPDLKTFESICIKVGPHCHVNSLLELWSYNGTLIRSLTITDILEKVNAGISYSPVYGTDFNVEYLFGGVKRNRDGNIYGAKSTTMLWVVHKKPELEEAAMDWEKQMIALANVERHYSLNAYVYATRTFDDEGYGAVNADVSLLTAGFIIVFVFIILVLGRFNLVENKLYVSLAGILCIGLAILFCYGLAMMFGFIYGPIHALMPFLLLGIGVDDMFVIVGAYKNLSEEERKLKLEERIAISLKHSGVSITVTSITDIVAFGIGGSTVIPALSAFCAYAALGILGLYFLVSTFFVACLTLDQRRIDQNRNALFFCYVHKDYIPNKFSQWDFVPAFIKKFYAPALMKLSTKISIVVVTIGLTSVNIWSFTQLRQDFDLNNYIPDDSYATAYVNVQKQFYPDRGYDSAVYCDQVNYYDSQHRLEKMAVDMNADPYIQKGSINFWYPAFINYLQTTNDSFITMETDTNGYPQSSESLHKLLIYFLQQRAGRSFGPFIKFDNSIPPKLVGTYIPLVHTRQSSSAGDIEAMESLRTILDDVSFSDGRCFCYGFKYLNNETNKVLKGELYRNLALAAGCVFVVTLMLIANLWTSILVFTCVVFTVIDVTGALQFWGVTIDTASSILIILCVGLAVDYSAHVGHTFMTITGSRESRAKATLVNIGPAVLNGGLSTFLAFVLLADSKSYGFALFFRVFMTVVLFGLYHGLVYLPVILSLWGPDPYQSADKPHVRETTQYTNVKQDEGNAETKSNHVEDLMVKDSNADQLMMISDIYEKDTTTNKLKSNLGSEGYCHHHQEQCDNSEIQVHIEDECDGKVKRDHTGWRKGGSRYNIAQDKKCDGCQKVCVVCLLQTVQQDITEALQEMKKTDGTGKYCTCNIHKNTICDCANSTAKYANSACGVTSSSLKT